MMQSEKKNFQKVLYLLLSILVATAIWFYVDEFGNNGSPRLIEQEVTDIPIEYLKESVLADRGLMMLDENTSTTVDLTLEGTRRLVTQLDRDKIRVTADLSTITNSGTQSIELNVSYAEWKFNDTIQVKKRTPSRAVVNITELSSKEVDVRCELVGNVAEGYSAGQVQLSQDMIEVRGQAKDIEPISYAKVTLNIGKDAEETVSKRLTCNFYDESGHLLSDEKLILPTKQIQATLPVYVTKELTLAVAFKEAPGADIDNLSYTISPSSITVSGEATKLKNVNMIVLGEFDLLDLVGNDSASHSYSILIPDGCQNLSGVTRATLEVSFKDMAVSTVETTLFQYLNQPENKTVTVLSDSVPVRIFGTSEDVAAVTGENITVVIDLSDYTGAAGTYTVPAYVDIMANGDIGVSGTYELQIKISEERPPEDVGDESPETNNTGDA